MWVYKAVQHVVMYVCCTMRASHTHTHTQAQVGIIHGLDVLLILMQHTYLYMCVHVCTHEHTLTVYGLGSVWSAE